VMKIAVTQDALLRALAEGIRDERDHGGALMRLLSRLVNEASRQGWFETNWRTEARLKLAQLACGDVPNDWQSAAPALDVIAEAARWALKAQQVDGEERAALLAITRLVDVERSLRTSSEAEHRPALQPARRRKAKRTAQARRARMGASSARPAAGAKSPARPAAKAATIPTTHGAATRKANGVALMMKRPATKRAKPATKVGAKATKPRRTAKAAARKTTAASARKANGAARISKRRITAKAAARKSSGAAKVIKRRAAKP